MADGKTRIARNSIRKSKVLTGLESDGHHEQLGSHDVSERFVGSIPDADDGPDKDKLARAEENSRRQVLLKNEDQQNPSDARTGGFWKSCLSWTLKERLMVLAIAFAEASGFASLTIISPLYPSLANQRGMSQTTSGLVFSTFAVASFLSAPMFAYVPGRFGVRMPMVAGLILSGISSVAFGLLEDVHDLFWFATASFLLRILLGVTYSAYMTAAFATVTTMFQSQMGLVMSVVEIVVGVGLCAGPALGSGLFTIGGYKLPFIAMGVMQLIMTTPLLFLVPRKKQYLKLASQQATNDDEERRLDGLGKMRSTLSDLFLSWEPVLILVTITIQATAFIYFHPILQPFLENRFGVTEEKAGYVFLGFVGSYCLLTPLSGAISDAKQHLMYHQIILGLVLTIIGSLIVGPSVLFLSLIPTSLATTVIGLSVMGTGFAFAVIPTYQGLLTATVNAGFPSNVRTYGIVSALWNAAWALGETIGPAISSSVVEAVGDYLFSFMIISLILTFLTLLLIGQAVYLKTKVANTDNFPGLMLGPVERNS